MRGGREAIVKAAMRIFARKGYSGASIREICQMAGVTKPVLYYHFRGKAHLYRELMSDSFDSFKKARLQATATKGTLRQRLSRMVYSDFLSIRQDPQRTRFLLRMVFMPGEQHPLFDYIKEMEKERRFISGVLQEGIDAGTMQGNAKDLATALMGMQLMATLEHLFTSRTTLTRKRANQYVDLLLQGCRTSSSKGLQMDLLKKGLQS